MFRIISGKSIFAFLILTLILTFIGNNFLTKNSNIEPKLIANENLSKKIMGAIIYM
jgi:hypothetical protein